MFERALRELRDKLQNKNGHVMSDVSEVRETSEVNDTYAEIEEKLATEAAYPCANCGFSVVEIEGVWTHRDGDLRCFPLDTDNDAVATPDNTLGEPILEVPGIEDNPL